MTGPADDPRSARRGGHGAVSADLSRAARAAAGSRLACGLLVRAGRTEAVFENASVAYPRRIIYRRAGRRLSWRIEGTRPDGQPETAEFVYRAARFNRRCPPSSEPRDPELVAD